MKKLAADFPQFEFVSAGLLRDSEASWFEDFSKDLPANYTVKPNLSEEELIALFQDSQNLLPLNGRRTLRHRPHGSTGKRMHHIGS